MKILLEDPRKRGDGFWFTLSLRGVTWVLPLPLSRTDVWQTPSVSCPRRLIGRCLVTSLFVLKTFYCGFVSDRLVVTVHFPFLVRSFPSLLICQIILGRDWPKSCAEVEGFYLVGSHLKSSFRIIFLYPTPTNLIDVIQRFLKSSWSYPGPQKYDPTFIVDRSGYLNIWKLMYILLPLNQVCI